MNININNKKTLLTSYTSFFLLTVFLLWIKTFLIQVTQFNLGVEGATQKFLLFFNPLGSALLFLGLASFAKGRRKYIWLMIIQTLLSILLFANVVYYRFFSDFITLPTLFQTQNFGDVSGSIPSLLKPYDILFFMDTIFLLTVLKLKVFPVDYNRFSRKKAFAVILFAISISFLNLGIAEADRPQLLTRGFDRHYIVKYLGMYNYTIYDTVESSKASAQRVFADSSDITEVINFTKSNYAEPNPKYFGAAKGKNVIYIHLESLQNFMIDYKLNGIEVTPFLNSLVKHPNSLYFDNFYHQTAQGKTSDAEFMLENSLFGLPQGSAFITKGRNTFQAAPAILGQSGYSSAVFHGNAGSFWNRNEIYKSFGYDHFYDLSYFQVESEDEMAEYGLMDKPFFQQSMDYLTNLPQPFYTKFITVTHHYPFQMNENDATIERHETGDASVDGYFQTARYLDEAIQDFFHYLKEAGLYDNSIIILYGDHYGISQNHNKAMEIVLDKEITPVESAKLQAVPLIIHTPGLDGATIHTYGGQIDLLPTLFHLLGIDTKEYIQLGTDLLSEDHQQVVAFRNGDFVSPTAFSISGKFYNPHTGELLEGTQLELAKEWKELVGKELALSDKVVNGDLLRFYTPNGFTPIDRANYHYSKSEETN